MLQSIQQAVKPHDKFQIEIKLDYELLTGKETRYQVSTYIFVPQSLGINPHTYSQADFYRDVQNYIRLKTPNLILRDIAESSASPLTTLKKIISTENWAASAEQKRRVITNFKLLSATLKSSTREHFGLIHKRVAEATPESKVHLLIHNLVEEFLNESQKITASYRALYAVFNLPNVDEKLFTAYKLTDESISLLIEENSLEMIQIVEAYLKKGEKIDFKQKLSERVQAETRHRRSHGYRSVLKEGDDNEEYTYRTGVLKKYASSVLYLSTAKRREGTELEHLLFAIAAGISMIFATLVAFYFQILYGNFTFPVFVALVVGYMFKDRIKELGRSLFANYLRNSLYDHRITIRTQDGAHQLGVLREKVAFVKEKEIPGAVLKARNRDQITEIDNQGQGEYVIRYSKEIVLNTAAFKELFADAPQITGINDIIRYDVRAYLNKMAEPIQPRPYLNGTQLTTVTCHKVYHVNIISRYKSIGSEKQKTHRRIRLILNREGIKRVEHVHL